LEQLPNLKILWLSNNRIKEIKGLEQLSNLQVLNLHANQIKEISGVEHLSNLQCMFLRGNPIRDDEWNFVDIGFDDAQRIVKYCQEKVIGKKRSYKGF
jgi:hypothetical protein